MNINALIEKYTYSHATPAEKDRQREFAKAILEMVKNEGCKLWLESRGTTFEECNNAALFKALEELKK